VGVIVEGGHPGLQDADARRRGWLRPALGDAFSHEPLDKVFADWYQQPVFASLTDAQRRR
jgi:2-succinyl-6-hydroxy-2,4-cyclohexadiene-1-carboxylate synthase